MAVTYGIDVSKWQGVINWEKVKNSGKVDYVILRAGIGTSRDVKFEANYHGCKKYGIPVGAYWYCKAKTEAQARTEAETFYNFCKDRSFEFPIYYDVEEASVLALGKTLVSKITKAFCNALEAKGYFVGVYASKSHLDSYMDDEIRNRYTIWVAHYGVSKTTYKGAYDMWQKSDKGAVQGITGQVDLDECYRDFPSTIKTLGKNGFEKTVVKPVEEFTPEKPVDANVKPAEEMTIPEKPVVKKHVKVICKSLNIRMGPGTSYRAVGLTYYGNIHVIQEEKDGWIRIGDKGLWISANPNYVKKL